MSHTYILWYFQINHPSSQSWPPGFLDRRETKARLLEVKGHFRMHTFSRFHVQKTIDKSHWDSNLRCQLCPLMLGMLLI